MPDLARPELIATPEWLAGRLGDPAVRVLDLRWRPDGSGPAAHEAGRIPGSLHLDWIAAFARSSEGSAARRHAGPAAVAALLGELGTGAGATLVCLDDTTGQFAAFACWTLLASGVRGARVLDGGWPAWEEGGYPVEIGAPRAAAPEGVPGPLPVLVPEPRLLVGPAELAELAARGEAVLVDARGPLEHRGLEGIGRRGTIPGSIGVPAGNLHAPGAQRLREPALLRALLDRPDLGRGRRIVCFDAAGTGAARLAHALLVVGHEAVAVADGGWPAWLEHAEGGAATATG